MDGQQNDRQMFTGSWTCSGCGGAIAELPFQPRDDSNLLCRDCHKAKREAAPAGERKMYSGDWKCSVCNGAITELPFEPRETGNLMCKDCFKKSKGLI